MPSLHPAEVSQSRTMEVPRAFEELPLSGLGRRFFAVILDTCLIGVVFVLSGMLGASHWGGLTAEGFSMQGAPAIVPILTALLAGFLYYWLAEGWFNSTLGKSIAGIAVRRADGRPCGLPASLVRNLLRVIDGAGFYAVAFLFAILSRSRQRLGDRVAGTIVIRQAGGIKARAVLLLIWMLFCGGCLMASYWIHRGLWSGPA